MMAWLFGLFGSGGSNIGGNPASAALSDNGVREITANRSPRIDQMVQNAGAPLGSAWCAAAASDWLRQGGVNISPTASVANLSGMYAARGALSRFSPNQPGSVKPGDLLFEGGSKHVGMVTGADGNNIQVTEGNYGNQVQTNTYDMAGLARRGITHIGHTAMLGAGPGYQQQPTQIASLGGFSPSSAPAGSYSPPDLAGRG